MISGPSGAGKGTVIARVLESLDGLSLSVSATTRPPRPGEVDGVQYHFLSRDEFERAVGEGSFLEWVEYGGNLYGTLRSDVEGRLAQGSDVILEIELRGARNVRRALPDAELIFIAPPSFGELAATTARQGDRERGAPSRLACASPATRSRRRGSSTTWW